MSRAKKMGHRYRRHMSKGRGQSNQHVRPVVAIGLFVFSLLMVVFIVIVKSPSAYSQTDGTGTPAPHPTFWAAMPSESVASVIAAAKTTPMYQSAATGNDIIGRSIQQGNLGTPVLVKPYRNDVGLPQKWVIPVENSAHIPLALLTFVYDASNHRLRASEFDGVTGNMFYTQHPFPYISANQAMTVVQHQQRIQVTGMTANVPASQPTLIYYPSDQSVQSVAGGTTVINPIWRMAGSDGRYYYVDETATHVHISSDLHVASKFAAMPATLSDKAVVQ